MMGDSEFPEFPDLPESGSSAGDPVPRSDSGASYSGDAEGAGPPTSRRVFGQIIFIGLVLLSAAIGVMAGLVFVYSSDLPQVRQLEDYRPDVMTEIYADDGTLIGTFAIERRVIVSYDQIPPVLRDAVLSIEDRHFESHWGVDIFRIVRAGITDLLEWRKAQGASTLTQQLSRMLFLTPEKSFRRKLQEVLLAIQIERRFTKPQIFTMYANQVSLAHGNFGFAAAAQFFFGKHLSQLTLPEASLLGGLPRTPTAYSPLLHPERALQRRNQVLLAMLENKKITYEQYREAKAAPLGLNIQKWTDTPAPYFVEDVRQVLERKYGMEAVDEKGLRVYTTLNLRLQQAAERALRRGLEEDDKRRSWRGPELNILKSSSAQARGRPPRLDTYTHDDWKQPLQPGQLLHGLVIDVKPTYALVRFGQATTRVTPPDFAWTEKLNANEVFSPGDVDLFRIRQVKGQTLDVTLEQRPDVQGALVAIDNATGAITAIVGGYDYEQSKFNRARQAERQAGSSFKVYLYAQALLDGLNPFDLVLDSPVTYQTTSGPWSPHNYDEKFLGNISYLHALAESRNIPAVRLLTKVGIDRVMKLCRKFGITSRLGPNLSLALGASDLTLVEHTSAFATFPNDGVRIAPRIIRRVTDYNGRLVDEFQPEVTDVLPASVARLTVSMLREVVNSGTATRAKAFAAKYPIAGKTGTTNDFTDAWFVGFSPRVTCGVWVGFDDRRSLGPKEEGARVALPIWMEFMEEALKGQPPEDFRHSPLLSSPDQVREILASSETDRLSGDHASSYAATEAGAPGEDSAAPQPSPPRSSTPAAPPGSLLPVPETSPRGVSATRRPGEPNPAGSPAGINPPSEARRRPGR